MTMLDIAAPVQQLIPLVEERMRSQTRGYHAELGTALEHLLASGGKRVRPTITLLVGAMLGVEEERAIDLAAAVELLHTATLVHDDLIDGALLRRGSPTLNATWNSAATVLAGDFLFSQAASLAAGVDSVDAMRMFANTLSTIVNGEISQIFSLNGPSNRQEYYQRIYAKTASMFELAARAPAYLALDGEDYAPFLLAYGHDIGMAFQIVDDVLDFSSDSTTIGKPAAHDLRQGLLTLPTLIYAEENPEDTHLRQFLQQRDLPEGEIDALIGSIRASGAVEQALDAAKTHGQAALDALEALPSTLERQALAELADYVLTRLH